ncbi:MAG: hypothetical protein HRT83_03040, partial [Hyphomicrobiaceae bacterium]|nr:hypothetical protein [Hyphomicrobiaceae bacterium]
GVFPLPHMLDPLPECSGKEALVSISLKSNLSSQDSFLSSGEDNKKTEFSNESDKQVSPASIYGDIYDQENVDLESGSVTSDVSILGLAKLPSGLAVSLGRLAGLSDEQIKEITNPSTSVKKN